MERRFFEVKELRAEGGADDPKRIVGYAAIFNSLSNELWGFREQILPGAFADSIAADDIRALWSHDPAQVLGRTKSGSLSLEEDAIGLKVIITPPDTQVGRDALALIERGDVDQMSFGFRTLDDEWDENDEGVLIRSLRKVKLYEVSPVAFPAYNATSVAVRKQGETWDPVYGEIVQIPAGVRGATATAVSCDDLRAQQSQRSRQIQLARYGGDSK